MLINHGLLDWMQAPVGRSQGLDGADRFPFQHPDELDASIDGLIRYVTIYQFPDGNGASATVTLGTPFLGTHQAAALT